MSAVRTINGGIYEAHQCNLRSVRYEIALRHAEELDRLRAENERLHERLEDNRVFDSAGKRIEVTPGTIPDGIACRDETIRLQDNDNEWLGRALERSQGAEADVANLLLRAERAEAALAGARRDALEEVVKAHDAAADRHLAESDYTNARMDIAWAKHFRALAQKEE